MKIEKKPLVFVQIDSPFNLRLHRNASRATFMIRAGICEYWKNGNGPCNMCPLPIYQKEFLGGVKPSWDQLRPLFLTELKRIMTSELNIVRIFHGGSYLHENEVELQTQLGIIKEIIKYPQIKILVIEAKPEYIKRKALRRLQRATDGKIKIQVNMGLEIADEKIRQKNLNKGFTNTNYRTAISLLNEFNMYSFVYVIIQPIGITSDQAITSIIDTTRWVTLIENNTEINLLALYIEKGTKLFNFWKKGEVLPPNLITVVRSIINAYETHPNHLISFGGIMDNDEHKPVDYSKGCLMCEAPLLNALKNYKETLDINILIVAINQLQNCKCV